MNDNVPDRSRLQQYIIAPKVTKRCSWLNVGLRFFRPFVEMCFLQPHVANLYFIAQLRRRHRHRRWGPSHQTGLEADWSGDNHRQRIRAAAWAHNQRQRNILCVPRSHKTQGGTSASQLW
jgi:hypothetical protein